MFTLKLVDLEYETGISIWELEIMIYWNNNFAIFSGRYTNKFTEKNENMFINILWLTILCMNIGISNWHNWSFDPTRMNFLIYFSSLHDSLPPSTWNSLVHTSWGEMERCEKRDFSSSKCEKISWNIKTKCITDFLSTVRSSRMKNFTCHYEVST